ncbi:MAG: phage/plasmid primase, P4 family [Rhodospirillaceae bacterium]
MSVEDVTRDLENARPVSGAEAVARVLDGAQDAGEYVELQEHERRALAAKRGAIARIVDGLLQSMKLITDDTNQVYKYDDAVGAWSVLSTAALNNIALNQDIRANAGKRREIVDRIKAATYQSKVQWGRVQDWEIPCANGILDVRSGELRPHAAENMLDRCLPVKFDAGATAPRWLSALDQWFPPAKDGGRRAALQEFFGYVCLAHARYKRALVLYGDTNTGKSVPVMLAKALVGSDFTCQLSVVDMDDPQRRSVLKGKALNIMTELSASAMVADGGFKTLVSTEEPVMLDAKYVNAEMYVPTAKHIIATNNLPKLSDHTAATFNRLLIIPFDEEIPESKQDRALLEKLQAELPGILVWAVEGAKRLVDRHGQWPVVEASRAILTSYRDEMNPVRQFIAERLIPSKDTLTPLQKLTDAYNRWNAGHRNLTVKQFGKLLRDAGHRHAINEARYKDADTACSRVCTCLRGFRIAGPTPAELRAGQSAGFMNDAGLEVMDATIGGAPSTPESDEADDYER